MRLRKFLWTIIILLAIIFSTLMFSAYLGHNEVSAQGEPNSIIVEDEKWCGYFTTMVLYGESFGTDVALYIGPEQALDNATVYIEEYDPFDRAIREQACEQALLANAGIAPRWIPLSLIITGEPND